MKIKDVKIAVVSTGPWPTPIPKDYEWTLVRVITDEQIDGYGETFTISDAAEIQEMKRRLIGEDPTNLNRIQYLASGRFRSGIEIACWDILGKKLGAPLYKLFGGEFRRRIRMYADSGGPYGWGLGSSDPEDFTKRARQVLDRGFDAMKIDLDTPKHQDIGFNRSLSDDEIDLMVDQVKAVRDVIGEEMPLAIDCHGKYSVNDAIRLANRLEDFNIWWLEDPIPDGNIDALLEVKKATRTPISAGENLRTRYEFRSLIEKQAANIIGPDSRVTGGLLEFKAVMEMADLYYIPCGPHNMTSPIGTVATAHVCAAAKNFLALEHHFQDFPWWENLVKEPKPLIDHGYLTLPDKPGIGIEINEKEVLKHIKFGEDFFS